MNDTLRDTVAAVVPEITALRRELHRHPEVRFAEHWTSARIQHCLEEAGIAFRAGWAGGTGIVAEVRGGGGPVVALRADMDALELEEQTGLPHASERPGLMHACGHDGHMACLCGAAKVLHQLRERLPGAARFIFQPAEEQGAGGRRMVAEGALDGAAAVFAQHAWPGIPLGKVGLRDGCVMASADFVRVTITGKGGHGANPGACVDPVLVAAHITTALQSVVSRELHPWSAGVVTVGRFDAGRTANIIPETATLEATIRAITPEDRDAMRRSVERIAVNTARAFRAEAAVYFGDTGYPPLITDAAVTGYARTVIELDLGPEAAVALPHPFMTSEDFAYYTERVPGAFLFLGTDPADGPAPPALHSPYFDFNDAAIPAGITTLAALALRFGGEDEQHG